MRMFTSFTRCLCGFPGARGWRHYVIEDAGLDKSLVRSIGGGGGYVHYKTSKEFVVVAVVGGKPLAVIG